MSPTGFARRNRLILITNIVTAVVFGVLAIVVAFTLPPKGQTIGVLPLVVGIALICLGLGVGLWALTVKR